MPRKTTKVAHTIIEYHNEMRIAAEEHLAQTSFLQTAQMIAELIGIAKCVEKVLDAQGCNHGTIIVDSQGNESTEEQPSWRVSFNTTKE